MSGNRTIAKNTLLLYFRMMITMVIQLYTSRVILQVLGVNDYGIYQAVGGIVGFLSLLNGVLSTGSSRFLTFALGEGDKEKLKRVFSTTLTGHICLALIVVIIAETGGLWFLYHKMNIPPERMDAALVVFHLSIVTSFFSLTQVPYNASIIAHEKMGVYAYVSIFEAVARLAIVYILLVGKIDRLILYAILLCLLQVGIIIFYRFYCVRHFEETHFKLYIDKKLFKEIAGFSGWSLFANSSIALNSQGVLILLNMFFSSAVVAARSISLQVNSVANQFVSNFQTAANPQIVKLYAAKDYEGSKRLLLQTTKYSYFLMLLLALPIFLTADSLLTIWLGVVPEYTVVFLQLVIIQSLFQVFDTSFYRALYAKGRLKENALISPIIGFLQFPIVYFLFKIGCSPIALSWASLLGCVLVGVVVKPLLVIKIVDYSWKDIISVFVPCIKVTLLSLPLPVIAYFCLNEYLPTTGVVKFIFLVLVSVFSVGVVTWFWGLDRLTREKLLLIVKTKLYKKE